MCEDCDKLSTLVNEINAGARELTLSTLIELATGFIRQAQHPLAEALADLDGTARLAGDDYDLIERVITTLAGLTLAVGHNTHQLVEMLEHVRAKNAKLS